MTFFNWNADTGNARVSSYLWIYIVVTVIFTGVTIGLWYFFVVYRRPISIAIDEESTVPYKEKVSKDCRKNNLRAMNIIAQLKHMLRR
jgi:heme/copper-type cytochrome/quinol oxidase subunit 2